MELKELKKIIDKEVKKGKEEVAFFVDCGDSTYELYISEISGFTFYSEIAITFKPTGVIFKEEE